MTAAFLTSADEPQQSGAIVAIHHGDYRYQEIWVRSGANIGNWYPLGGEFERPRGVDVPLYPTWHYVLSRGPVTLLAADAQDAYRTGWVNGRRHLREQIEQMGDDDA